MDTQVTELGALICLITATFSAAITIMLQLRPLLNVVKSAAKQVRTPLPIELPPASVVVYTSGASERLTLLLEQLMNQNYPGQYEVIVVNEGEDPLTDDVLLIAEARWPNLRHTFTPSGTRNLSPRKLALTLGIKAAHNDIVVHTTTDTLPTSTNWLARMVTPFTSDSTELVIGISTVCEPKSTGICGANRSHFCMADNVIILDAALRGKAFSGDANNLAYRLDLFFRHSGFSESLDIFYGDDDLFVSTSSTTDNSIAVVTPDSIVNVTDDDVPYYYRNLRLRRAFTASYLKQTPRRLFNLAIIALYTWLFTAIATTVMAPQWIAGHIINGIVLLSLWISLYLSWNRAAKVLNSRRFTVGLPFFLFSLPWRKLYYRMRCRSVHRAQINWQSTRQTTKR